jgi:hypothetical protein
MNNPHHKKSLSTPAPASDSVLLQSAVKTAENGEPSTSSSGADLYVSFGSTGRIQVRKNWSKGEREREIFIIIVIGFKELVVVSSPIIYISGRIQAA